jgi:carbamoyltransferase
VRVLGLYDGHNSNAALVCDGAIVAAVEEERYSRVKNHDGRRPDLPAPARSARFCLEQAGGEIDAVALALEAPAILHPRAIEAYLRSIRNGCAERAGCGGVRGRPMSRSELLSFPLDSQRERVQKLVDLLRSLHLDHVPVHFVNHHVAHAAGTYYTSGFRRALVVTLDGRGDRLCGLVATGSAGSLEVVREFDYVNSLGHFYSAVTVALGWRAVRDEGKVMALAGHAEPDGELRSRFARFASGVRGDLVGHLNDGLALGPYPHTLFGEHIERVRALADGHAPAVVAATAQAVLEHAVTELVDFHIRATGHTSVALSGGIFANVAANARLARHPGVERLYVHPAMSDAGLGAGAALRVAAAAGEITGQPLTTAFLGPGYAEAELVRALREADLTWHRSRDPEREVAAALAAGAVVARFQGSLEYGPRGLGARSIIAPAGDSAGPARLNRMLGRSAVMPFAPATLDDDMHGAYEHTAGTELTSEFMTMSYVCRARTRARLPGVVHVDGTARPQRVRADHNPSFHRLLREFKRLTGVGTILNTSFNRHEEPIVCSPDDAVRTFAAGCADVLHLGPFVALPPRRAERPGAVAALQTR